MIIIASHFLGIPRIIIIIVIILTPQNKPRQQLKYTNWNKQTKIRSMRRILQAGKVKSRPRPRPAMCVCVSLSLSLYLQSFFNCRIQPLSFVWTLIVMSSAEPRDRRSEYFVPSFLPNPFFAKLCKLRQKTEEGKIRVRRRNPSPPPLPAFILGQLHPSLHLGGWMKSGHKTVFC
jgi:hypothetical protein